MDKLELEIRREIDELNTSVSLIDRLDSADTMDDEKQEQLLSSTRAVFDNVNSSHAKNSLTDSQISIISKHDGYPDSGHFYATPLTPTTDSSGECCDKLGTTCTSMSDGDRTLMTDSSGMMRVTSDTSTKDTKAETSTNFTESSKSNIKQKKKKDSKGDKKAAAAAAAKQKKAAAAAAAGSPHLKKKSLPSTVVLGVLQLIFSVTLAALGGLVLARNASLAMAGTGLWCGAISGIAGSLGLMNVKMAKTGFLAVNLICVASSTLGLALTGIGAVRDANLAQQDESVWVAVTAGSGLLMALALHFLVSVFSVYYSALKLCSRPSQKSQLIENVINSSSPGSQAFMSQQKVEDYINSLQVDPSIKDMMYQSMLKRGYGSVYGEKHRTDTFSNGTGAGSRPVMLVPACAGNGISQMMQMYPSPPPNAGGPPMMYPPNLMPPGVPQYPPMYPDTALLEAHIARVNRKRSMRSSSETEPTSEDQEERGHRHRHHHNQEKTFTYTGLDRDIADSYLAKEEEKLNSSSIVSTTAGGAGGTETLNRHSGKEGAERATSPPLTYHHDLMLIDHRHHFERYQDVHM
ncbi:AAEL012301-PA [Aedes aegypti]|uniref:AAEL012301-PA n=1 Tax=Aedes aegypti TaxID=7159 RepID=Q16MI2_AEDAE|nr:AAEL012301-PA [Aedes aegypti]